MDTLWTLYRAAGRPTLDDIVVQINSKDRKGTASKETVRKTLRGVSVPLWLTLETLVQALCELANRPYSKDHDWNPWDESDSYEQMFRGLWNDAMEENPKEYEPF